MDSLSSTILIESCARVLMDLAMLHKLAGWHVYHLKVLRYSCTQFSGVFNFEILLVGSVSAKGFRSNPSSVLWIFAYPIDCYSCLFSTVWTHGNFMCRPSMKWWVSTKRIQESWLTHSHPLASRLLGVKMHHMCGYRFQVRAPGMYLQRFWRRPIL